MNDRIHCSALALACQDYAGVSRLGGFAGRDVCSFISSRTAGDESFLAMAQPSSAPVTKALLAASVLVTALVQTQRITPSVLGFPASIEVALAQPWRLLTAFLYGGDGFSVGYVVRLHIIGCLSRALEFALAGPHTEHPATPEPPDPKKPYVPNPDAPAVAPGGTLLVCATPRLRYVGTLAAGGALIVGVAAARPTDLGSPFLLTHLLAFLAYLTSRAHASSLGYAFGVGVPSGPLAPYLLLLGLALGAGGRAALPAIGGVCAVRTPLVSPPTSPPRPPPSPPHCWASSSRLPTCNCRVTAV